MTTLTYAQKVNGKYKEDSSNFVDLKDRLNQTIQTAPFTKQLSINSAIKYACQVFEKLHPTKKKMEDLHLCESIMMPLSDILIEIGRAHV